MKFKLRYVIPSILFISASCLPSAQEVFPATAIQTLTVVNSPTGAPSKINTLWISAAVPEPLRQAAMAWGIPLSDNQGAASIQLDVNPDNNTQDPQSVWFYALAATFPTVTDAVSASDLRASWNGEPSGPFAGSPILMSESTYMAFSNQWGEPSMGAVKIIPADQILDIAWNSNPSWAIIPFEELGPRWKVIAVDEQSPIQKDFNPGSYPLVVTFSIHKSDSVQLPAALSLPPSNRDPEKLTTIILTGVTALVRATAYTIEKKGVTYPGRDIRDLMREADIAHISNEIPFFSRCGYPPNPGQIKLVFCSYPRYMELLTDIGTDLIELTGNHFGDYGPEAMLETLDIYNQAGIPYYGGGSDLADARTPIKLEHNGNKVAFIGCNRPDIGKFPTATGQRPGAAPCEFDYMTQQINELKGEGYQVIATFQWNERDEYDPEPIPEQVNDFHLMADSGAVIVSGSQAHFPMAMEFYNGSFLHYGLGNLFFDQMGECCAGQYNRWEFMDRYAIYDNRVVSIELLTMMLEDYARPRPMTLPERTRFLNEYFNHSGWTPFVPTPIPQPTLTLTPILLPGPAATSTP